ncbi:hypothetical protein F5888DRAFT_248492 [Russula emetica]|nr:hypothetical protein F5888DRAFT_248492 [Russula emetica]
MKEHWCKRFVLLTYLSLIILFMCTVLRSTLSNKFNSTSAVATSMFPKGRTKRSLVDAAQASARFTMSPHFPFNTSHSLSHMISPVVFYLQPVIASINPLLMVMVM